LIANGIDIWGKDISDEFIKEFRRVYCVQFSALPTNTQFGERGVKESSYVSLSCRNKVNRSILAISRSKMLPEALALGRVEFRLAMVKLHNYKERGRWNIN